MYVKNIGTQLSFNIFIVVSFYKVQLKPLLILVLGSMGECWGLGTEDYRTLSAVECRIIFRYQR
jgi:hypothetical protein